MIDKSAWLLRQLVRQIWVRSIAIGLLGAVVALTGIVFGRFIPGRYEDMLGAGAVDDILTILASSMLAVVPFSLSVAVRAFAAAAESATPRASRLLEEDSTTQNVLSVFVGAFLFSLVGIIALATGAYGAQGRVVLFLATVAVIALVVGVLLRWINHIMRLRRVGATLRRVEAAPTRALIARAKSPYLGGQNAGHGPPLTALPVLACKTGYVQHVDMEMLSDCAEAHDLNIWLVDLPGSFATLADPLFLVVGRNTDAAVLAQLRDAFTIAAERNFDQDPRFGLIVLAEIASRALSPAVNDPGTAIDVLGRTVRILGHWLGDDGLEPEYPRIMVPAITGQELIEDAFLPIARDGAALVEVQIRLQKALAALARMAPAQFAAPAAAMALEAADRARQALANDIDRTRLGVVLEKLAAR
ncbi:hypothetical protein GCM10007973_27620 [Polymorphobacter multimanifer]|uniref:DUF2254 domain-containing protein n=1 Tax=Polymorphobacter multimanifer TaxID=1070431 RepID=UPI00166AD58A|nr:DUF2254 domain-containing protein [Polymorphobacter multimanifer]GGI89735.1 hypothetical protein GCM10007973_27620 [Polymorphobacter multimanifer]